MNCKIFSKKIILLSLLFFCIPTISYADECKYSDKIQECSAALESFLGGSKRILTLGASIKSITDYPCLQHNYEMRTFQIIMDEEFKNIDEQMEKFLYDLYTSKNFYFNDTSDFTILEALDHIETIAEGFEEKFDGACNTTVQEALSCSSGSLTVDQTKEFIDGSQVGYCRRLADKKISIFKSIAYNGLALNSAELEKNAKKAYNKKQRTKYDEVLDLMMLHLSYIERLWKKTTSFTEHV